MIASLLSTYTTYDRSHPWVLYHYRIPDAIAWAIGFSVIRAECLICGRHQRIWLWTWFSKPNDGEPKRQAILEQHRHQRLSYHPLFWAKPMGNILGWQAWRDERIRRN